MLVDDVLGAVDGLDGHLLDGLGDAAVDVRLDAHEGVNEFAVANSHADAPASHVVDLRKRVELDGDITSARHLEDGHGAVAVVGHVAVGVVVADGDVVLLRPGHDLLEEGEVGDGGGGVVGVVQPEDLGLGGEVFGDCVEVGQPAGLLAEGQLDGDATGEHRANLVNVIAGVGREGDIAGVDEGERHVRDALLRADEGEGLTLGVEGALEAALVPVGDGLAQLGQALRLGVAVVGGVVGCAMERVEDVGGRGEVGVADAEGDDIDALGLLGGDNLGDLGEEVGGQLFDPLGQSHDFSWWGCSRGQDQARRLLRRATVRWYRAPPAAACGGRERAATGRRAAA